MAIFIPSVVEFCIAVSCFAVASAYSRTKEPRGLGRGFVTPQELHALMSKRKILLYDIREPIELVEESEIIKGAQRIAPDALLRDPSVIPLDQDSVVYCACQLDEKAISELRRALAMRFSRMKILRGGLIAWKASGYQTIPYLQPLHPKVKG